jgi:hypothetical protein
MSTPERVREVRERLLEAGTVVARADGRARALSPVAIGREEGLALHQWVRKERALRTLETGLGFAISTLFICEALLENGSDGRHVATDPYQFGSLPTHRTTYAGVGLQILEEAGARDLVEFYPEESQIESCHDCSPRAGSSTSRSSMGTTASRACSSISSTRLGSSRRGGIVFVDDAQLPGVRRAVDFCVANLGWVTEDRGEEDRHRWLVLRTGQRDVFSRDIAEFVDF